MVRTPVKFKFMTQNTECTHIAYFCETKLVFQKLGTRGTSLFVALVDYIPVSKLWTPKNNFPEVTTYYSYTHSFHFSLYWLIQINSINFYKIIFQITFRFYIPILNRMWLSSEISNFSIVNSSESFQRWWRKSNFHFYFKYFAVRIM